MKCPKFVIPPMEDTVWLCHVRRLVKLATFEGVYSGKAMTLRPMQ